MTLSYGGLEDLRALVGRGPYALSGVVVTPKEVLPQGALLVDGGRVAAVFEDESEASKDVGSVLRLPYIIAPGFVDIHIHGAFGVDVYDVLDSPAKLSRLRLELASRGVTSFCPTLYTSHGRRMAEAAALIAQQAGRSEGSRIVGINFEGPFISRARAGAQDQRFIVEPDPDLASELVGPVVGARGLGCVMTVAPELRGALDLAKALSERGVVVAAGHSDADYETAMAAFRSGFTHVTHLYNAMRPFGHRDPGLVGAALDSPEVSVELIVDSHHVDPSVVRSTVKAKGVRRTTIVSDALWVAGLASESSGSHIKVEGGVAKLLDGTIAGSVTLQEGELRVAVADAALALQDALEMLGSSPASVVGRADIGAIRVGAAADLVFLDRDTLRVVGSVVGGDQLFANPDYAAPGFRKHLSTTMYGEILEQPLRMRRTLEAVRARVAEIASEIWRKPPTMVYFVGSGSSYHAAVCARFAFKRFVPVPSVPVPASEFSSWVGEEAKGGLVVAISQSGESSDTLRAAERARAMGLRVICVTNSPTSTLTKLSDGCLVLSAGPERAVTATKSFTCSLVALYALAVELGRLSGHLAQDEYHAAWLALSLVPADTASCLAGCEWRAFRFSEGLASAKAVFTMGSGVTYPVALEAALKLKEAANIYAEGFALREFLHGPIQLLDKDTVVLVFEPPGGTQGLAEVKERFARFGSRVITVSPVGEALVDMPTPGPHQEEFYPAVATIPAQLLALFVSLRRGLDPDSPSKLTKVVR